MIEVVIKKDGTEQEFSATKLNHWGQWAARSLSRVDWSEIVLNVVSSSPKKIKTEDLQKRLIKACLDEDTWGYNRMAGRLYAPLLYREAFECDYKNIPTIQQVQSELVAKGLMVDLGYSDEEYKELEKAIDHKKDFKAAHFELHQARTKYCLKDAVNNVVYETQQFMYMRMGMAIAANVRQDINKVNLAKELYTAFSNKKINAPTPNHVNLGTPLKGFASCCTYTTEDTASSLAIGDHIAYSMTCMSAGIGAHIKTRSLKDPVRGGVIPHGGKLPYYRALVGAIGANLQNGRGGACTTYFTVYDPEVEVLLELKNPMTPESKKIRGMDYSLGTNKFFARKVARDEEIGLFSYFDEPELYEAQYSKDINLFDNLYEDFIKSGRCKKFVRARDMIISSLTEAFETGRSYLHWTDEINTHTPFKEPIYSSNLCAEIAFPTKGYTDMLDLYSTEDHGRGEIGLCSLAALNVGNIDSDEEYARMSYLCLLMIDVCIDSSEYTLPHLGVTAKARRNAGVGMVGLAYLMAKEGREYTSLDGKEFIHDLAETHAWHLYNASLQLAKELEPAEWIHKTRWVDGWTPLDTYNKKVDEVGGFKNKRDWKKLSAEIVQNGGIRNSVCVAYMPSESSSKASGTTNAIYPVRDLTLIKTDDKSTSYWAAPEGERLKNKYQKAWDIPTRDMIEVYAIFQKWTDQGISADLYRKVIGSDTVSSDEMIGDYLYMTKLGLKTRYYQNSKTSAGIEISSEDDSGCAGGACKI